MFERTRAGSAPKFPGRFSGRQTRRSNGRVILPMLVWLTTGAIFILDLLSPWGLAVSTAYALPVALNQWVGRTRFRLHSAGVCSVLIVLGFFLSPSVAPSTTVLVLNRLLSLAVVWIVAFVVSASDSEKRVRIGEDSRAVSQDNELSRFVEETEENRIGLLMRSVLDHSIDSVICIGEDGRIVLFNRAAEKAFGYAASEVIGRNVAILMPEPHSSEHDAHIERYLRTGESKIIDLGREVEARRKDGSTFPADLAVSEFRMQESGERYFTGILRDITERKALESQLRHSQKLEAVGELARGIAHDFNNLLTVIQGFSQLLLSQYPEDDSRRDMVRQILGAGERAATLTQQLLAFSRQQVIEPRVLDLNAIIAATEKLLRRLIGEDVQLTVSLHPKLPSVKADPAQVEQVIINLALNGRDAMPEGGHLTIETRSVELDDAYCKTHLEARPGQFVMVAVSDTGSGMTPEVKARVFEPFFTTKGQGKGTGLGLAVVHGIVKQSDGSIEVYSEAGVGTTFKVYLPAVDQPAETPPPESPSRSGYGTETILVAEDEDAVRDLITLGLRQYGYEVLTATNGKEALDLLERSGREIDLLVADLVMPHLSGVALAEKLRSRQPNLKVVFVSGYTNDAAVLHGMLPEEGAFLQKPFTPDSLAVKVREVLDWEA